MALITVRSSKPHQPYFTN